MQAFQIPPHIRDMLGLKGGYVGHKFLDDGLDRQVTILPWRRQRLIFSSHFILASASEGGSLIPLILLVISISCWGVRKR